MLQHHVPGGRTEILRAYSLSKAGERQEASSIRDGVIRFRQLEAGSTIVVQYVYYRSSTHFLPNHFVAQWFFSSPESQHEDSTWVLVMPKDRFLNVEVQGEIEQSSVDEGELRIRTFRARRVPPLALEPHQPPLPDLIRTVSVSTVRDWGEYARWEMALLSDGLRATPAITALAHRITDGKKTPREKLDALYHHVAREIRYQQDYENTIAGVRPHTPPMVLERGYGDCKDKALLLLQLAREVGIELRFALLRTARFGKLERKTPNQQFNHAIVYLPKQPGFDEARFFDPTATELDVGNLPPDDQGVSVLVIDPRSGSHEFLESAMREPAEEGNNVTARLRLASVSEARMHLSLVVRGAIAAGLRAQLRNAEAARKAYDLIAALLLPGSSVIDASTANADDTWKPLVIDMEVDDANAIQPQGDRYRLNLPAPRVLSEETSLTTRTTPLWLGAHSIIRLQTEVELPSGYRALYTPGDFHIDHSCVAASRTATAKDGKLALDLRIERRCATVPVADYHDYRQTMQRLANQVSDQLVFEKAPVGAKPARAARAAK
jgi:hypothetical protein